MTREERRAKAPVPLPLTQNILCALLILADSSVACCSNAFAHTNREQEVEEEGT
jgi:hypothetical protein